MLAVDTHVVVRLLVNDDRRQGAMARRLFESDEIFIGVTVLLESAWVLESVYELSAGGAVKALRGLLGLANVRVEDAGAGRGRIRDLRSRARKSGKEGQAGAAGLVAERRPVTSPRDEAYPASAG